MGNLVETEPETCKLTPGCFHCAGHLPPCMGSDGQRVYRADETPYVSPPKAMTQCKRCGREATHFTIDGGDSDACCADYPRCKGDVARDVLGRMVREVWIEWAQQQPVAKQHWLKPYDQLDEADKEVDRRIGERLFAAGRASVSVETRR